MPRDIDYYELLGVSREATETEIRERFRSLAREAHPDRAPTQEPREAEAHFQELTEAVNVLTNPEAEDVRLRALALAHAPGGPGETAMPSTRTTSNQGIAAFRDKRCEEAAGNFALPSTGTRGTSKRPALPRPRLVPLRRHARPRCRALETAIALDPQNVPISWDAG